MTRRILDAALLNVAVAVGFHVVTSLCRYLAADRSPRRIDLEELAS